MRGTPVNQRNWSAAVQLGGGTPFTQTWAAKMTSSPAAKGRRALLPVPVRLTVTLAVKGGRLLRKGTAGGVVKLETMTRAHGSEVQPGSAFRHSSILFGVGRGVRRGGRGRG